jgi:hypothetical protein
VGFSAIIGLLAPIFTDLIKRVFPDPEKQAEAEYKLQELLLQAQVEADKAEAADTEARRDVITAEMNQGGWASQWRSYLMMVCISIVAYNWVIISFLNAFLRPLGIPIEAVAVPPELWTLVTVGLGGYLTKETVSQYSQGKVATAQASHPVIDEDKLAKALRKNLFKNGMTEEQWKAIVASAKESVE